MAQQIAEHYGLRTINVLTGFKFIGEQIGKLEEQEKADSYVFGFKMYISVSAENKETAEKTEEEICRSAEEYLNVPKMDIRNPR